MKKQMKSFLIAMALIFSFSSIQAQLNIGGGIGFGTEIKNIAITVKANYSFTEKWRSSASFSYFFPNQETEFLKIKLWEFNADAHYIVTSTEKFTFYPLAGLSITGVSFDYATEIPFFGSLDVNTTEVGLNLGAGGELKFTESIAGYAEIKYVVGGFDQLVINAGVLFIIGGN